MTRELLKEIMRTNSFIAADEGLPIPLIAVFRNTGYENGEPFCISDNGKNCCDTILLVDKEDIILLTGRSYPHDKYQTKMVNGTGRANYIASGYYPKAWRKGFHFGFRALVQNRSFLLWRSHDMELLDDDDYNEFGIVADNFHGWAPLSAGCVTVEGNMRTPSGDWEIADKWIYSYSMKDTFFNAVILNHADLDVYGRLRMGSKGIGVAELQREFSEYYEIKVDGDFGPWTHEIARRFQREAGLFDNGIIGKDEREILCLD